MKQHTTQQILISLIVAITLFLGGCQSAYYGTMEKLGHPKRDIMVSRVEKARDAQTEAKDQFATALEQFSQVVNFQGGALEEKYELLNDEYQESKDKAEAVEKRIDDVQDVAHALFKEWEKELEEYTSDTLRQSSEQKLKQTKERYTKMMLAMEKAESKIQPVLSAFYDQVLFLKHNLNAQAIASLQEEFSTVENEIEILIQEMEKSIQEADAFIIEMQQASQ
ncbi:MAG: DUF2959 domain-containing protein [Planctomycetota bacterium]|jgi:hypothetical protein